MLCFVRSVYALPPQFYGGESSKRRVQQTVEPKPIINADRLDTYCNLVYYDIKNLKKYVLKGIFFLSFEKTKIIVN